MIGSHNTFTALQPSRWWMRILTPFARCQRRVIIADMVDIRLRQYDGDIWVSHGLPTYCTFTDAIDRINQEWRQGDRRIAVRVLLEGDFTASALAYVMEIIDSNPHLDFYCGRDKTTWQKKLSLPEIAVDQQVGSMKSRYGKLFPWLYTKLHKSELDALRDEAVQSDKYVLFDFV